jgi:putative ABC transport system permease protein
VTTLLRFPATLAMLIYQSIALALAQIWANKIRGILTTLGILIGVAAVSAVITLISGMKQRVLDQFESFGTNKIFVEPHFPHGGGSKVSWRQIIFRLNDFDDMLEHCPSVSRFTHITEMWPDELTFGSKSEESNVNIMGVDPEWHVIEHRYVTSGRPLTTLDNDQLRPVCLINTVVRDKLQMDRDPIGQYLEVSGNRMLVVGLLEPPTAMMGNSAEMREVIVPFNYAVSKQRWSWYSVMATSRTPALSEDAKVEIEFFMRLRRHVKPGTDDTFHVQTAQRELDEFNKVATVVTMIATGIVGISLLVGGVGIMNIMLVSVSERTREIGLRKAVGARPGAILLQFLVEAVMLCLIGGAIGVGLGQAISTFVASFLPKDTPIMGDASIPVHFIVPASAIMLSLGFSAGVGLIFGMFPAIKAARLDPIEALRHE